MSYREMARDSVVVSVGNGVVGLDVATGALTWKYKVSTSIERLFPIGKRVLAVTSSEVIAFERASGEVLGRSPIDNAPDAAALHDDHLVLVFNSNTNAAPTIVSCFDQSANRLWTNLGSFKNAGLSVVC